MSPSPPRSLSRACLTPIFPPQVQHLVRPGQPGRPVRAKGCWSQWYLAVSLSRGVVVRDGWVDAREELTPCQPCSPPVLSVTRNDTVRVHAVRSGPLPPAGDLLTLWLWQYNGLDVPTALHHHVRIYISVSRSRRTSRTPEGPDPLLSPRRDSSSTTPDTTMVRRESPSAEFLQDKLCPMSLTSPSSGEHTGASFSRTWECSQS